MVVAMIFIFSSVVLSTTVTHNQTGLSFTIPDDWAYGQEGDHFAAQSPDESVILMFYVGKAESVADLMENIGEELDGIIDDAEIDGEPEVEEINGLVQVYIEGSGYYGDDEIDFDMTMVLGGRRSMSIIALGDIDEWQEEVDEIYNSIEN